jgi:hypothetical protein
MGARRQEVDPPGCPAKLSNADIALSALPGRNAPRHYDLGVDTGWGIRFQVFVAIMTGVLVIAITTAVVIGLGRSESNADGLDGPSGPLPTLPFRAPLPSSTPAPTATASPTPEASLSKKPPKPASPTPAPNKLSLSCESSTLLVGSDMNCTVGIEQAPSSPLSVALKAATDSVQIPSSVSIGAGKYFSDPFVVHGNRPGEGSTAITATVGGLQAQFAVTVVAP